MLVRIFALSLIFSLSGPMPTGAQRAWSPGLLHAEQAWTDRLNEAVVRASGEGLRVEVAPGRQWAIAAAPGIALPPGIGKVRVRVRAVGGGGRWLLRLYGDVRGSGRPLTTSLFEQSAQTGPVTAEPDPRMLRPVPRSVVQVQLGVEGAPGAWALFESVEFLPGPQRARPRAHPGQVNLEAVELMPNLPRPFKMLDWRAKARAYDRFVFDFDLKGKFLPLIWLDGARINMDAPTFGLPSYVGDTREQGSGQESITCMGAVLGATLAGVDKRRQTHDYVRMCEAFYNARNGSRLVLNNQDQGTGGSFWYEIWPHVVFYGLAARYPGAGRLEALMRTTANRWCDAVSALDGNFDHTAFNFATMQPVDNGHWKEPDAAAGLGWLEYAAWVKFRDPKYLQAADRCMQFLQDRRSNPYYENMMPWGALAAARMNAELGRRYDTGRFLNWCFGISDCRGGWGVIVGNWGGYDCSGLLGSVDNRGGYAFAMNTFTQAGALVPLARYDTRYARAIGKWMLNLANAARLFYPKETPHQCCGFCKGDPEGVIAYEGLRREWEGKSPCATGDPVFLKWGPKTDRGLYGSGYVGFLGALIHRTSDEKILALDCLATDFFHDRAYPTYLCYNPYDRAKTVEMSVGSTPCDLYDAATGRYLRRNVRGKARFVLPGDSAVVMVLVPGNGRRTRDGAKLRVNGVVVDYAAAHTR